MYVHTFTVLLTLYTYDMGTKIVTFDECYASTSYSRDDDTTDDPHLTICLSTQRSNIAFFPSFPPPGQREGRKKNEVSFAQTILSNINDARQNDTRVRHI